MEALAQRWLEEEEADHSDLFGVVGQADRPEKADSYLYVAGQIEKEMAENDRIAQAQIDKVTFWRDQENAKLQRRLGWLVMALENYARNEDRKTVRLPNGTLKLRAAQPTLEVDEEAFFAAHPPEELVRIIPEQRKPDKKAIRELVKSTGEVPEGCEWTEPDQPTFSYETV